MEYFSIYSFYRFTKIKNKKIIKKKLDIYLKNKLIKGTILLADEGINASIAGDEKILNEILIFIKKILNIRKINNKINYIDFLPFNKIKVRLKKEIVSLGLENLNISTSKASYISPSDWDKIIMDDNFKVIDVRNKYEIKIGNFTNTLNPNTENFREFPKKIKEFDFSKNDKIAMYCTGGIRCEKAAAFLFSSGFKNIYQLEGGILNYLEYKKQSNTPSTWKGDCFVFDDRVAVDKNLMIGKYSQCYGCRRPITEKEILSKYYLKGVFCPFCYKNKSKSKIARSQERQNQIEKAKKTKTFNPFLKIKKTYSL